MDRSDLRHRTAKARHTTRGIEPLRPETRRPAVVPSWSAAWRVVTTRSVSSGRGSLRLRQPREAGPAVRGTDRSRLEPRRPAPVRSVANGCSFPRTRRVKAGEHTMGGADRSQSGSRLLAPARPLADGRGLLWGRRPKAAGQAARGTESLRPRARRLAVVLSWSAARWQATTRPVASGHDFPRLRLRLRQPREAGAAADGTDRWRLEARYSAALRPVAAGHGFPAPRRPKGAGFAVRGTDHPPFSRRAAAGGGPSGRSAATRSAAPPAAHRPTSSDERKARS
jgi:hypothetical protein